jgi:hypothetical protein
MRIAEALVCFSRHVEQREEDGLGKGVELLIFEQDFSSFSIAFSIFITPYRDSYIICPDIIKGAIIPKCNLHFLFNKVHLLFIYS